jgi:hypothetical protein
LVKLKCGLLDPLIPPKNKMECPICYDELGVARATMSCNHAFHFRCLSNWFVTQDKGSCPMCRKKADELEDLARPAFTPDTPVTLVADDDEEDNEDEVCEYLDTEYPAPSLAGIMFLDAGEYVRDMDPPYTLAKVKDTLEAWVEGEEWEGQAEDLHCRSYKEAIEGLERWNLLQEATPQTLTAN